MEQRVALDDYNSDLNFVVCDHGYGASTLNYPLGFRLMWAGARATHGVCKGKVYFEVKLESYQDARCEGQNRQHSHLIRVGWSSATSSFALGEDVWSFGYGGWGKFSTDGKFSEYGENFGQGDVIGAMLDLESKPAKVAFMKNGQHLGTAFSFSNFPIGNPINALFPHVYLKNCNIKVNFGQQGAWFTPPRGFRYLEHIPVVSRVRGAIAPLKKLDCEVIMTVGLPGSGKTTWATNFQKQHPEKRYNILGTDLILDQMRVVGTSRAYPDRWQMLIEMATECFDVLLRTAASKKRNYILDQTNVYASARKRKLTQFSGFRRVAVVVQPDDTELLRRSQKRTKETKKEIPFLEIRKMKANYSLPETSDNLFDRVDFAELPLRSALALVRRYNRDNIQYKGK
ncbi:unnamed protein product [Candidula unifasciata]|uniref:B30.2/SPRY domain-containing protein n=1 Tax=Candidula unifasciata TaxID=100452 RepID=A0A8S3YKH6_9EUPU|nr:unnamed protein product [Candidula unifasciata]